MRNMLFGMLLLVLFVAACGGPKECKGVGDDYDLCVLETATEQGDASLCMHIKLPSFRTWCYNSVANATDTLETCDLIEDAPAVDFCKQKLYIKWDQLSSCEALTFELAKDGCYDVFAQKRLNVSLCTQILEPVHKENCIEDLSRETTDPYGCLLLDDANIERKNACILSMSLASRNVETCNEIINDPTLTGFCILNIAVAVEDPSICELIEDATALAICEGELGKQT